MINLMGYSVLVDNNEQAKKLQEIAFKQGFTWVFGCKKIQFLNEKCFQFGIGGGKIIKFSSSREHYQDKYITKKAHFNELFGVKFVPTAMRCTQEQFDAIKPKLKGCEVYDISSFEQMPYLFNYRYEVENNITNYLPNSFNSDVKIYEEWNEELFLKNCGIEDDTLEQQLEKAKAEVERLEKEIENKKIKVGDWAINTLTNVVFKVISLEIELQDHYKKITNPQLIELLENEIK